MAENTSFSEVYDSFLSKVTDDMYMELFPEETHDILEDLLLNAIPKFEFPRVDVSDYDAEEAEAFNVMLTQEEINILATYMVVEWLGLQLASVENTRLKYSGPDFKFTSQANQVAKLQALRGAYSKEGFSLQRLYKRRTKNTEGKIVSTLGQIMESD